MPCGPITQPGLASGASERRRHTIDLRVGLRDEATPASHARFAGVVGNEIWLPIGPRATIPG